MLDRPRGLTHSTNSCRLIYLLNRRCAALSDGHQPSDITLVTSGAATRQEDCSAAAASHAVLVRRRQSLFRSEKKKLKSGGGRLSLGARAALNEKACFSLLVHRLTHLNTGERS
ncbi:hypothetical protein NDU88_009367 [Pleurodeles waltl]|uniref:Uncharacterized protein n=1 Tax=Pleurodeles waltl TaxID=8319 RepID=A0AAV7QSU3_PLEWA|nr:hypothetical protein NDU88_009367 [Pleurodeles waltl]